jgi:hypothetical protein
MLQVVVDRRKNLHQLFIAYRFNKLEEAVALCWNLDCTSYVELGSVQYPCAAQVTTRVVKEAMDKTGCDEEELKIALVEMIRSKDIKTPTPTIPLWG